MEFNFFEPYRKKPEKTNPINLLIIVVLLFGTGLIAIFIAVAGIEYININSKLTNTNNTLNEKSFVEAYAMVVATQNTLEITKRRNESFAELSNQMKQLHTLNVELLTNILTPGKVVMKAGGKPMGVYKIDVQDKNVQFTLGTYNSKEVGLYEEAVRESSNFENIKVTIIEEETDIANVNDYKSIIYMDSIKKEPIENESEN